MSLEADWDEFCRLETYIGDSETVAIRARWDFGQRLLPYEKRQGSRGGSLLGDAVKKLVAELDVEPSELYDRRSFAELYPTEDDFSTCVERWKFWHEIRSKGLKKRAGHKTPPLPASDFRCITVDPPWPIQKITRDVRPAQGQAIDYPTLTVEEIRDLVGDVVTRQDGCHVYLWTTHRFLPDAFDLFESWAVKFECLMTWVKNVGPTPFSWMYDTEHVLFGRRGSLALDRLGLRLSFAAQATGHSVKPAVFYERVAEASPGPRLAMFERAARPGFEVWGDEVRDAA